MLFSPRHASGNKSEIQINHVYYSEKYSLYLLIIVLITMVTITQEHTIITINGSVMKVTSSHIGNWRVNVSCNVILCFSTMLRYCT